MPAITDYQRIDAAYARALRADEATPGQSPQYWESLAAKPFGERLPRDHADLETALACGWRPQRESAVYIARATPIVIRGRRVVHCSAEAARAAGLVLTTHGRVLLRGDAVASWSFA